MPALSAKAAEGSSSDFGLGADAQGNVDKEAEQEEHGNQGQHLPIPLIWIP